MRSSCLRRPWAADQPSKQAIKASGVPFRAPAGQSGPNGFELCSCALLDLHEGYTAAAGPQLREADLSGEAIRLTRAVHNLLPDDGEAAGCWPLCLLTDARRTARTGPDGELIPLTAQDRTLWIRRDRRGHRAYHRTLSKGSIGAFQLQAAIAAVQTKPPEPRTPTGRRSWPL